MTAPCPTCAGTGRAPEPERCRYQSEYLPRPCRLNAGHDSPHDCTEEPAHG